ncbi:MAG: hypothetical protein NUV57_04880 [archaeon]|nr:hypothetical protein [archaeon]
MPIKKINSLLNPWSLSRRIKRTNNLVDRLEKERAEAQRRFDEATKAKRYLLQERMTSDPLQRVMWNEKLELAENEIEREGRLYSQAKSALKQARMNLLRLRQK